jgi:hypothetical protein
MTSSDSETSTHGLELVPEIESPLPSLVLLLRMEQPAPKVTLADFEKSESTSLPDTDANESVDPLALEHLSKSAGPPNEQAPANWMPPNENLCPAEGIHEPVKNGEFSEPSITSETKEMSALGNVEGVA